MLDWSQNGAGHMLDWSQNGAGLDFRSWSQNGHGHTYTHTHTHRPQGRQGRTGRASLITAAMLRLSLFVFLHGAAAKTPMPKPRRATTLTTNMLSETGTSSIQVLKAVQELLRIACASASSLTGPNILISRGINMHPCHPLLRAWLMLCTILAALHP